MNTNRKDNKALQLKDPEYFYKVEEIAQIHYELNPDRIEPEELIKYKLSRSKSRVLRRLIDLEYQRLQEYKKSLAK